MAYAKAPHHKGTHHQRSAKIRAAAYANPDTRCWRCKKTLAEELKGAGVDDGAVDFDYSEVGAVVAVNPDASVELDGFDGACGCHDMPARLHVVLGMASKPQT